MPLSLWAQAESEGLSMLDSQTSTSDFLPVIRCHTASFGSRFP